MIDARSSAGDNGEPLLEAVRSLVERFSIARRADAACCGTTVAQAAALTELAAHGPMRSGDLARRLGVEPSTMTRNLDRLIAAGLAARVRDTHDGRARSIRLTAAGRAAARTVLDREISFARTVLEDLQSAAGPALATLEALLAAVDRATSACCPEACASPTDQTPPTEENLHEQPR